MPTIGGKKVTAKSSGGSRVEVKAKTYPVRLVQIAEVGMQPQTDWKTKEKKPSREIIYFTFEFSGVRVEQDGEDRPKWLSRNVKAQGGMVSEKSNYAMTISAIDEDYDPDKDDTYALESILGKPCAVTTGHTSTGNPKIVTVTPIMEGFEVPALENDTAIFSVKNPDLSEFKKLPDWLQKVAIGNEEFEGSEFQSLLSTAGTEESETETRGTPIAAAESKEDWDDDIPF